MNQQRIILAGGSGFLGGELAKHFSARNWEVVILTRSPQSRSDAVREVAWDAKSAGDWVREFECAVAVVNLTGRSVDCRYTAKNRQEIMDSRVNSTRVVGQAIAQCKVPPLVWLNSSTATVYTHTFGPPHDESSREMDSAQDAKDAFSVEVAQAWERALFEEGQPLTPSVSSSAGERVADRPGEGNPATNRVWKTRKVALRTSMVLGLGRNSVFPVLRRLTKLGLGGRQGGGKQFVSWIHVEDFCRAVEWIIDHEELSGPINQCAPNPLPNAQMMRLFREVCRMPIGLPATEWMLEIGAFFLRTETELIFKSRRVVPGRLLASGFKFRFPTCRAALEDLESRTSH
jgi:NAD dependent epimerase/dehydratase family enzyme